jgi:predicted MFS family arabinose efflux permease
MSKSFHVPQVSTAQAYAMLGGAALMMTLAMGIRQNLGLFQAPASKELGIAISDFALAISVQQVAWGVSQPIAGIFADKHGTRWVAMIGSALFILGIWLTATAQGVLPIILGAGVLIGVALACTTSGITANIAARVVEPGRRTLAFGIVSAAGSVGTMVTAPIAAYLLNSDGWRAAVWAFVILAFAMLPAAWIGSRADKLPNTLSTDRNLTLMGALGEARRHTGYVVMALAFFVCGLQLVFITTHLPTYLAQCGMDPSYSAVALMLIGGFNILSSWLFGWLGDKYPKRLLLGAIYLLRSLTVALFFLFPPTPLSVVLFGAATRRARAQSQGRRRRHAARQLVVITGLSGSGKSSLAFDTIYAEGQRRYVESLSAYARQFLELMQKPDVDSIEGLSPAISIEQKTTSATRARPSAPSPRSTTTCACCGRASACPIRPPPACRSRARPSARWSTGSWRCRKARASICWRRSCAAARASTARNWPTCKRASSASRSTASSTRSRGADARQEVQARHRRRGRPHRRAPAWAAARRLASRPRWPGRRHRVRRIAGQERRSRTQRRTKRTRARMIFSEKFACPVSGFTIPRSSRGCSRSTIPSAPARPATAWASKLFFDPTWSCPTSDKTLREGAIAPWAKSLALYTQTLEALASTSASTSTRRGATCPKGACATRSSRHRRREVDLHL